MTRPEKEETLAEFSTHWATSKLFLSFLKKVLNLTIGKGDLTEEGNASRSLGTVYFSHGNFQKSIEYHEKHLKICKRNPWPSEGRAYANLVNDYKSLGDFQKAIEYHEKHLKTAIEIGDWAGEGKACTKHDIAFFSLGDFRKPIENHAKALSSATFDPN